MNHNKCEETELTGNLSKVLHPSGHQTG